VIARCSEDVVIPYGHANISLECAWADNVMAYDLVSWA
jgi:hypothetical protein